MRIGLFQHHRNDLAGSNSSFPLWQGYLKSYFEKYSPTDKAEIEFVHTVQELKNNIFDIVALSSTTVDYSIVTELADELKSLYKPVIILGGYHISTLPRALSASFDYGIMGEGEQTFLEIINVLIDGNPSKSKLEQIPGLVFHGDGGIVINSPRGEIKPLDIIPFPERSNKFPIDSLITSRGCHYRCAFCANARTWNKARYFSASHVVEELQLIASAYKSNSGSADVKSISFLDDLAVANRERLKEIVSLIETSGMNEKLTFVMNSRAEIVDVELTDLMKRMNVNTTILGLESGSDRVLKELKVKSASVAQNQKALDVLHKAGIQAASGFIIGYFDETKKEIEATLDFILRNVEEGKLAGASLATLTPIPGTTIWQKAIEKTWFQRIWIGTS